MLPPERQASWCLNGPEVVWCYCGTLKNFQVTEWIQLQKTSDIRSTNAESAPLKIVPIGRSSKVGKGGFKIRTGSRHTYNCGGACLGFEYRSAESESINEKRLPEHLFRKPQRF
jgi:hypothetical protein